MTQSLNEQQFGDLIDMDARYDGPLPEHTIHIEEPPKLYHVTSRDNRDSITRRGLIANDHFERYDMSEAEKKRRGRGTIKVGVFVDKTPQAIYGRNGGDVYEVSGTGAKIMHATGDTYFPKNVPPSRIKRVGHTTADRQVHMQPEETCTECKAGK